MTEREIAGAFQVSVAAVKKWGLEGAGKRTGTKAVLYDIRDAISYRFKEKTDEDLTLVEEQKKLMAKRRERLQLQIDEQNSLLIPLTEVERVWSDLLSYFRAALDASPSKVARDICSTFGFPDQVKVENLLASARDDSLAKLVAAPEYRKKA